MYLRFSYSDFPINLVSKVRNYQNEEEEKYEKSKGNIHGREKEKWNIENISRETTVVPD